MKILLIKVLLGLSIAIVSISTIACVQSTGDDVDITSETKATEIADAYISKVKRWPSGSYRMEFNRYEGDFLVVWALHKDDEDSTAPGGGLSCELYVDLANRKVVKELAFQ